MGGGSRRKRVVYWLFWAWVVCLVLGSAVAVGGYFYLSRDLPPIYTLRNYRPPIVTQIYSDDGTLIAELAEEWRRLVPYEDLPRHVILAFLAAEDHRFLEHRGVDWYSVVRAALTGHGGASTITMQVARSFFLTPERTYRRKLKESILAYRIEKYLSKEDILYLYLSQVNFGRGCYGIGEAARYYFNKEAEELTLGEAAMLAGLLPRPSSYNPVNDFAKARKMQWRVLSRMCDPEIGFISCQEAEEAFSRPLHIYGKHGPSGAKAPYFTQQVLKILLEKFGREKAFREGLKVFTTVNLEADRIASEAVRKAILGEGGLDKAVGFRVDKVSHVDKARVQEVREAQERKLKRKWIEEEWREKLRQGLADKFPKKVLASQVPDPVPLTPGETYQAVVDRVNDRKLEVRVFIGHSDGLIDGRGLAWVEKWLKKEPGGVKEYEFKRPSQILEPGDLVLVRVREKRERQGRPFYLLELEQSPEIQAALFSMEVKTGHVKALCGGLDFSLSQFNRATQATRQPGSAFKPIVYAAALDDEEGRFTPATVLLDAPMVFEENSDACGVHLIERYQPKNYNETFLGEMTLRDALAFSVNTIAVRLGCMLGVRHLIDYAKNLGIESRLDPLPCLPLGCSEVTLLELCRAYNVFASGGWLVQPRFISRIYDREGNLLWFEKEEEGGEFEASSYAAWNQTGDEEGSTRTRSDFGSGGIVEMDLASGPLPSSGKSLRLHVLSEPVPPQQLGEPGFEEYLAKLRSEKKVFSSVDSPPAESPAVISPQTAFLVVSMLKSVIEYGTGKDARRLERPLAGKTGTTNNYRDAWFIGFSPELLAGVWVGADDYAYSLGKGSSGGKVALPIWMDYMAEMLKDRPVTDFPIPPGIQWVTIDKSSGLRFNEACSLPENRRVEVFKKGTAPEQEHKCTLIEPRLDEGDLFRLLDE